MSRTIYYCEREEKLGSIQLLHEYGDWVIHSPALLAGGNADSTVEGLLRSALNHVPNEDECLIILLDADEAKLRGQTEEVAQRVFGFTRQETKHLYLRDLSDLPTSQWEEETSRLSFQTLESLGMRAFTEILSRIQSSSLDASAGKMLSNPERALTSLRSPEQDIPNAWMLAFRGSEPLGMLLPGRLGKDGTLLFIGIVPESRGSGFGRILHRKGLLFLSDCGIVRYLGSTTDKNLPMLRVFEKNGCKRDCTQIYLHRPAQTEI